MSLEISQNEDIINEIVPVSRGDDGLLEGVAIGDTLDEGNSSQSDEEVICRDCKYWGFQCDM